MSPPVSRPGDRKRFWFSLFYTTTQVFDSINAVVYWAILVPQGHSCFFGANKLGQTRPADSVDYLRPSDDTWFRSFWILNLWGGTVFIVLVEVMFLNSIKCPVPVIDHVLGLAALLTAYLGWAAVGKLVTGSHAYFFLDLDVFSSRNRVALHSAGFVILGPLVLAPLYGLIVMREKVTRRQGNSIQVGSA